MMMAVFWVVAPCSLEKFTDVSEVLAASIIRAVVALLPDYTVLQPRGQPSSKSRTVYMHSQTQVLRGQ
jgi:ABC-type uncharacterized transport system permease subunit